MKPMARVLLVAAWLTTPLVAAAVLGRLAFELANRATGGTFALDAAQPTTLAVALVAGLASLASTYATFVNLVCLMRAASRRRVTRQDETSDNLGRSSLRKVNARVLALSVSGALLAPASAHASETEIPVIRNTSEAPQAPMDAGDPGSTWQEQPMETAVDSVASADVAATAPDSHEHVVRPGENLWTIAESTLLARSKEAGAADIADYWTRLVETNRDRLADPSNPDLVFAGQHFVLPGK